MVLILDKLCIRDRRNIFNEWLVRDTSKKIKAVKRSKGDVYKRQGLDGEASLGNTQITYKLYDEKGNLLNECGELEAAAYRYFVEE